MSNMVDLGIDTGLLERFERGLNPRRPDESVVPARVLGYGEISTVFEIEGGGREDLALKRMPIFRTADELERYEQVFMEYNRILTDEVGLKLPGTAHTVVDDHLGRPVFFIAQRKLQPLSIGNEAIHLLPEQDVRRLIRAVLEQLEKVWSFSRAHEDVKLGIDGQISNWAIDGFEPGAARLPEALDLVYLDTSTPFIRLGGVEQLEPELFLRSAPSFLRWLLRWLFLQDVMDRYYDARLVAIDLIANFYKEQLPQYIAGLIETANEFLSTALYGAEFEQITEKQVRSYYREDALIWRLYLLMRKLDRFIHTRILRKDYPYILPGKIKR